MTPNIKTCIIDDNLHMRKMKEKESTGPVWDQPVHPSTRSPTDRENTPATERARHHCHPAYWRMTRSLRLDPGSRALKGSLITQWW